MRTPQLADNLRRAVLQAAIAGKLNDRTSEDARGLLAAIQTEKTALQKAGKLKKDKPLAAIREEEIPFAIPENWVWVRLGEIVSVKGGKRIPVGKSLTTENTGYIYIRVSDMKDDAVSMDNLQYVPKDVYPTIQQYTISSRDLYITCAGTIGRVGEIPEELDGANLTENADKLILHDGINKKWLLHTLNSNVIQEQIKECTTKVGQPKLAIKRIENFLIPLPPLTEQQQIVEKLNRLLAEIDSLKTQEQALITAQNAFPKKLRAALLQAAVQGELNERTNESARDLLAVIQAEKAALQKTGKLKKDKPLAAISEEEIPFAIPENWVWVRLGDIAFNHGQKTPDGDFTYIDISSIDNKKQKMSGELAVIKATNAPSRARKIVHKGDVLYATVRPYLLNMCVIEKDIFPEPIASTGFAVLCTPYSVLNEYLFRVLMSPFFDKYANSLENSKGVAYPAINDARLMNGIIPLPPLTEQQQIVAKLEALLAEIDTLENAT